MSAATPRKRKLLKETRFLKKSLAELSKPSVSDEDFLKYCEDNFNAGTFNFIKVQLELHKRHPQGYRYTDEFKQFALTIYFLGPKVYRLLAKTFYLPSKSTLCRITSKWNIQSGIDDIILAIIESKVNTMSELAKDCVLCADEMSIKTNFL